MPVTVAYQNLLPAFAVPWILQNTLLRVELPEQHIAKTMDATLGLSARDARGCAGWALRFFAVESLRLRIGQERFHICAIPDLGLY
jgi:hypothetical protein